MSPWRTGRAVLHWGYKLVAVNSHRINLNIELTEKIMSSVHLDTFRRYKRDNVSIVITDFSMVDQGTQCCDIHLEQQDVFGESCISVYFTGKCVALRLFL